MPKARSRLTCVPFLCVGLLSLALVFVGFSLAGLADTDCCDPDLEPEDDYALRYRARETRCEGFYKMEISSHKPLFEVMGITYGESVFARGPDAVIDLSCPWAGSDTVHVQALAIPPRTYYQMDAILKPGQLLSWPQRIIHAGGLLDSDIGVLAWLLEPNGEHEDRIFVPVRQTSESTPDNEDDEIVLVLRAHGDVEAVQWRIRYEEHGIPGEMSQWTMLDPSSYAAGRPIHITLPSVSEGQRALVEAAGIDAETGDWHWWSGTVVTEEEPSE